MPVHQTFGIIIAASAALLGIPKLLVELTAAARLEKRLEIVQKIADKAEPAGARDAIAGQRTALSGRLAATYQFRPSKADYFGIAAAILAPLLVLVGVQQVEGHLGQVVTLTYNLLLILVVVVIVKAYVRVRTLTRNRRLFVALGCPADPPVLRIPPFHASIPGRVTVEAVLQKARSSEITADQTGLTERARVAIDELERRHYGAIWARLRSRNSARPA